MIKNRRELLKNSSGELRRRRKVLLDIADEVFKKAHPRYFLPHYLKKKNLKKIRRIYAISMGKAAHTMLDAAKPFFKNLKSQIFLIDEGHPLPTPAGVKKTGEILNAIKNIGHDDLAMILISGGASAMFCAPVAGITLADKIATTKMLLQAGATIHELNTVRKHLSRVKGGRLAQLLEPATVWGFVISDVVGNDLSTIASGPLAPDPTTFRDALRVMKKYHIRTPVRVQKYFKKGAENPLLETPKKGDSCFARVRQKIVADHTTTVEIAAKKARRLGMRVKILSKHIIGEARIQASTFVKNAAKNTLTIASGETTVTCSKNPGYGGRNQEFVLASLPYLKSTQTLLSIGTDGVDGICPEPIAGAIGDRTTLEIASTAIKMRGSPTYIGEGALLAPTLETFLNRNDSYSFLKKTGNLIKTGPTGTNLGDLLLLFG